MFEHWQSSCACLVHCCRVCGSLQILLLRLMFLSVLVMALYTLFETDKHPEYTDIVAGMLRCRRHAGVLLLGWKC